MRFFVHNNPEAEAQRSYAHAALSYKTEGKPALRNTRVTPLGICLKVFVNETSLNLEKTTSSVLSVLLLINAI